MRIRLNLLAAVLLILCFCINPVLAQDRLTISGRVIRYDYNPGNGLWSDRGPIEGIEIILQGKHETSTASTDNRGSYRFPGLDSGTYVVRINPSDAFLITGPAARGVKLEKEDVEFVNFTLRTNGRVGGKVFSDDGVPLVKIAVNLLPFELRNSAEPHPMKAFSDANGAYYFEGVPEGRYVLGIHLDGSTQSDSRYPRSYYGATTDPDRATILELGEGWQLENIDLQLLAPLPDRIIMGTVLSQGGPAAGAWVALNVSQYDYSSAGHSIQCDNEGRFSYPAAEGIRYSAMAAGIMPDGTLAHSESRQIAASGNVDVSLSLVPAMRPQNLLSNADAAEGSKGWLTLGSADIENSAGRDACFFMRDMGSFRRFVDLPQGSEGQYAILLGLTSSEGINSAGNLYGLMESDQGRITEYLQGQQMSSSIREPGKWGPVYGIFRIPPGTSKISFSMNGSAIRFDDLGLYLLPTEIEAKLFIQNWLNARNK